MGHRVIEEQPRVILDLSMRDAAILQLVLGAIVGDIDGGVRVTTQPIYDWLDTVLPESVTNCDGEDFISIDSCITSTTRSDGDIPPLSFEKS